MTSGYIYLLQPLRSITNNEQVYKIGKTKRKNFKRFNEYPTGSILLLQSSCNDCDIMEKNLLQIFDKNFTKKTDYGKEYFQGDLIEMKKLINSEVMNEKKCINSIVLSNDIISGSFEGFSEQLEIENPRSSIDMMHTDELRSVKSTDYEINNNNKQVKLEFSLNDEIIEDKVGEINDKDQRKEPYNCIRCQYFTNDKSKYIRHCTTMKHKNSNYEFQNNKNKVCSNCGKQFKYRQGLHKHKIICSQNINNNIEPANKKLVLQLIKQNSELQSLLLEQNKHLMNCINI